MTYIIEQIIDLQLFLFYGIFINHEKVVGDVLG
jgi:hypothetical protein